MRAGALLFSCVLVSCGNSGGATPATTRDPPQAKPPLPSEASVVLRLPPAGDAREEAVAALLRAGGIEAERPIERLLGLPDLAGVDPARATYRAHLDGGGWVLAVPTGDLRALAAVLAPRTRDGLSYREEVSWAVLSTPGAPAGAGGEPPLPPGDVAVRVRRHPLLATFAGLGDTLELGFRLGGSGLAFEGRLVPGPVSGTRDAVAAGRPTADDQPLLDFLPADCLLRVETTLPATVLAEGVVDVVARWTGIERADDRAVFVRLLREGLTAIEPETGCALGVEVHEGKATFVMLGKSADGPASPLLAQLGRDRRSFGAVVLDPADAPEGMTCMFAWVIDAKPVLEGVPEAVWDIVGGLSHEDEGLFLANAEKDGWFAFAAGPRADVLARATLHRVRHGSFRSPSGLLLYDLRYRLEEPAVFSATFNGEAFAELPEADRRSILAAFGLPPATPPPRAAALVAVPAGSGLALHGTVEYAPK